MLIIRNANVYSPQPLGVQDIFIAGERIEAMGRNLELGSLEAACKVVDADGAIVVPGFIDGHVHITGGGGEGGFHTRTPELTLSGAIANGVTTVVGVLGTDGVCRSLKSLVAKVYGLRGEGLSAWCYTGAYRVPVPTLTGDLMTDIMMVEPIIGVGEVAVSDHRSSQPSLAELGRLTADARVAGMLSAKAGLVNVHLGDAPAGFKPLFDLCSANEIPYTQFLPTHCNRNPALFDQAKIWARQGGNVDFTASSNETILEAGELGAAAALAQFCSAGLSLHQVTVTSDGQGSLPVFDAKGQLTGLGVGSCGSLLATLKACVSMYQMDLQTVLPVITENPARLLKLPRKGRLSEGMDADLLLLDSEMALRSVVARGRLMFDSGSLLVRGTFE